MNRISDLIPKDKSDFSHVEELRNINIDDCEPIIWNLLEWIQDMNWPIAKEMISILPRFQNKLIPHIRAVFQTEDVIWKYWVLDLVKMLPIETASQLRDDIERLVFNANPEEKNEEVDIKASEVLGFIGQQTE